MDLEKKLDWVIIHLRYTQALCEVILENLPDKQKNDLIKKVRERVKEID